MPHHFLIKGIALGDAPLADVLPVIQDNRVNVVEISRNNIDAAARDLIRMHRLGVIVRAPLVSLDDFNNALITAQGFRATMIHLELSPGTEESLVQGCLEAARAGNVKLAFGLPEAPDISDSIAALAKSIPSLRFVLNATALNHAADNDSLLDRVEMIRCSAATAGNPLVVEAMRRWRRRNSPGTSFVVCVEASDSTFSATWKAIDESWQASIRG